MARDIKLTQDSNGVFDINFSNGDIETTDGLDSAFYMSVFYKQRADENQIQVPEYRQGHQNDIFNDDINYQIGSFFWLYSDQSRLDERILSLVEDTVRNDGLQWLIDDSIVKDIQVTATQQGNGYILSANFEAPSEDNSSYYDTFINTFN